MYPHILAKLNQARWAVQPGTLESIQAVLNDGILRKRTGLASLAIGLRDDDGGREKRPYVMHGGIAEIPVFGIIGKRLSSMEIDCGGCSLDALDAALKQAADDSAVDSVLLHFNSPGGTVTGVPETARRIANFPKPIAAFTDSLCASAAYWLASQCSGGIAMTESADMGSIGVYLAFYTYAQALEDEGVKLELIKAGEYKAMGHPGKDLADDERAMLQAEVDAIYADFVSAVRAGRGAVDESTVQGQCFMGRDALARNLCDTLVESFDEVIERMAVDTAA